MSACAITFKTILDMSLMTPLKIDVIIYNNKPCALSTIVKVTKIRKIRNMTTMTIN